MSMRRGSSTAGGLPCRRRRGAQGPSSCAHPGPSLLSCTSTSGSNTRRSVFFICQPQPHRFVCARRRSPAGASRVCVIVSTVCSSIARACRACLLSRRAAVFVCARSAFYGRMHKTSTFETLSASSSQSLVDSATLHLIPHRSRPSPASSFTLTHLALSHNGSLPLPVREHQRAVRAGPAAEPAAAAVEGLMPPCLSLPETVCSTPGLPSLPAADLTAQPKPNVLNTPTISFACARSGWPERTTRTTRHRARHSDGDASDGQTLRAFRFAYTHVHYHPFARIHRMVPPLCIGLSAYPATASAPWSCVIAIRGAPFTRPLRRTRRLPSSELTRY
jgi:hypothetical protein